MTDYDGNLTNPVNVELLWRVVFHFIAQGCSPKSRASYSSPSEENSKLRFCFFDESIGSAQRSIRRWYRASLWAPPALASPNETPQRPQRETSTSAGANNSWDNGGGCELPDLVEKLRSGRVAWSVAVAALHQVCTRVRIVMQERDSPRSIHVLWRSAVHNVLSLDTPGFFCTHGPRAPYMCGITVVASVDSDFRVAVERTFLLTTGAAVAKDDTLWESEGRGVNTVSHAVETPARWNELASGLSPVAETPGSMLEFTVTEETAVGQCSCCLQKFAVGLTVMFVEHCGHCVCHSCAYLCGQKHVSGPCSTTGNMPCPSEGCTQNFTPAEVRGITSHEDYCVLEINEIRMALREACVVCPSCHCTFEGFEETSSGGGGATVIGGTEAFGREGEENEGGEERVLVETPLLEAERLRGKFMCSVCSTEFCRYCNAIPFHHDRPCRGEMDPVNSEPCRFCGGEVHSDPDGGTVPVCNDPVCQTRIETACTKMLSCGHRCFGALGESECPPCLVESCAEKDATHDASDLCMICYSEELQNAPCLFLGCGHIFHYHCILAKLSNRWPTAKITFAFLNCPLCDTRLDHSMLSDALQPLLQLREDVFRRAFDRMEMEKITVTPADRSNPLRALNYYMCFRCNRPYFGGLANCDVDDEGVGIEREDLICGGCAIVDRGGGGAACKTHGTLYMEFKCKYCCNVAVWFCWGTTHFCDECHNPPRRTVRYECLGSERCPIGGDHPPNGVEFSIGCVVCRSAGKETQTRERK